MLTVQQGLVSMYVFNDATSNEYDLCKIHNTKSHGFKSLVFTQMKHAPEMKFCNFVPTPTLKQSMGLQKNNNTVTM